MTEASSPLSMPQIRHLVALALATIAPAQSPSANDERYTVELSIEPGVPGGSSDAVVTLRDTPPPAGMKLPSGIAQPMLGTIDVCSGNALAIVLDSGSGVPRLWIDHDLDGDLSDERTSRLRSERGSHRRSQSILARYEGEVDPTPLPLSISYTERGGRHRAYLRTDAHRKGNAVLGGRLRTVIVIDGNQDACFDDPEHDAIYIDLNGNGRIETRYNGNSERVPSGEAFRVGEEGWIAEVPSASGRKILFKRATPVPPQQPRVWIEPYRAKPGTPRRAPKTPLPELLTTVERQRENKAQFANRSRTLRSIGAVGTPAAFDALLKIASSSKERSIQRLAYTALGNPAVLEARGARLLQLARGADETNAGALAEALYGMGHPDREAAYLSMMSKPEAAIASAPARFLANSESAAARSAILNAAKSHEEDNARYQIYVNGVRNLIGGPPIDAILAAAKDSNSRLQAQAAKDLTVLGHPRALDVALKAAKRKTITRAEGLALAEALGSFGSPKAVAAMLSLLENEKLPSAVSKKLVEQLRVVRSEDSVTAIADALSSKSTVLRRVAAEVLAANPQPSITKALQKRAKREKEEDVLALILEALGDHGDPSSAKLLLKHAKNRKNPTLRASAVRGLARLGFQHPKIRTHFLKMLDASRWTDRVLALDAAAAAGDHALCKRVIASLDHEQWQVRLAATEALQTLRSASGVHPLIERLAVEPERRIVAATANALFTLTGVNANDSHQAWTLWWKENGANFDVPSEIPQRPQADAGGTTAGFYGIPVTSERVAFVIDRSGSMSAATQSDKYGNAELNRLDVAVRETLGAIDKLNDRARVNVVMFHTTVQPWEQELQKLSRSRDKLERHLKSQRPGGGTNLYDALEFALQLKDVDTIFVLSDGAPGAGKFVATPDILRAVRRENQTRRIVIHGISIGSRSELLRKLTVENGGRYVQR